MARPLRIEFPGAFYHVMARGNEKRAIYKDTRDRLRFLDSLESSSGRYGAVIHGYCLMNNHYHLLLETPRGNLAQIMHHINGSYTTYFNKKHERVGHLFQGRYRAILIDADAYCLALSRYIHMNPVKGGTASQPWDYKWSSCQFYRNRYDAPQWLQRDFVLSFFNHSQNDYIKYLVADDDLDCLDSYGLMPDTILGSAEFIEKVKAEHLADLESSRDLPAVRPFIQRDCIQNIVDAISSHLHNDQRLTKKMSIYVCHQLSGYPLKEIGKYFGVSVSAVSEMSSRFASVLARDQRLAETVAGVLVELNL